jgi:NhaP-type Na+/H+ or K+/H+ antiporter
VGIAGAGTIVGVITRKLRRNYLVKGECNQKTSAPLLTLSPFFPFLTSEEKHISVILDT